MKFQDHWKHNQKRDKMKVTGIVTKKSASKFGGESIVVNGAYYNSKFSIKCNEGDVVEFDDGGKNYCQKLKVVSSVGAPTKKAEMPTTTSRDRSIIRQNSLAHATSMYTSMLASGDYEAKNTENLKACAKEIVEIARIFEEYSAGDEDKPVGTIPADKDFNDE